MNRRIIQLFKVISGPTAENEHEIPESAKMLLLLNPAGERCWQALWDSAWVGKCPEDAFAYWALSTEIRDNWDRGWGGQLKVIAEQSLTLF